MESVGSAITDLKAGDKVIPVWQCDCQKCPRCLRNGSKSNICDVFLQSFDSPVSCFTVHRSFITVENMHQRFILGSGLRNWRAVGDAFRQDITILPSCGRGTHLALLQHFGVQRVHRPGRSQCGQSELPCRSFPSVSAWMRRLHRHWLRLEHRQSHSRFLCGRLRTGYHWTRCTKLSNLGKFHCIYPKRLACKALELTQLIQVVEGAKIAGATRIIGIDRLESKLEKGTHS